MVRGPGSGVSCRVNPASLRLFPTEAVAGRAYETGSSALTSKVKEEPPGSLSPAHVHICVVFLRYIETTAAPPFISSDWTRSKK